MSRLRLAGLVLFASFSGAQAEIGFGIRDSALSFTWLYGQAGDVRQTSGSDNPSRPLLSDGAGLVNGQNEEDPGYPFLGPWQASANWIVTHGYAVSGTRDDVDSIAATGFSSATANGDNCVSELTEDTNRLRLEFTVGGDPGSTTFMLFKALFTDTGPLANATARVDMFGPFGWQAVAIADSEGSSSYRTEVALGPGLYRLEGTVYARVVAPSAPSAAQYQMAISPVGETEPDFIDPIIAVTQWRSVRTHSGIGERAITLDSTADGNGSNGPTVETRQGGIQKIEVDFTQPVTLTGTPTAGVTVSDGVNNYSATSVTAVDADTIAIHFNAGVLPDQKCYTVTLGSGVIVETFHLDATDRNVQIRSLVGDTTGNGKVNLSDAIFTKTKATNGVAASAKPQHDVNLSGGNIDGGDALAVKALVASPMRLANCP